MGGAYPVASGLPRAENIDTTPATPSASCRSITALRTASSCGFARRSLPSMTTSTSYSDDGKRRSISSYWRNSGVSVRKSSERLSSTLRRMRPATASSVARRITAPDSTRDSSGTNPRRASPKISRDDCSGPSLPAMPQSPCPPRSSLAASRCGSAGCQSGAFQGLQAFAGGWLHRLSATCKGR